MEDQDQDFILKLLSPYKSTAKIINEDSTYLKNKLDSPGKLSNEDLEGMLVRVNLCLSSLDVINKKLSEYLVSRKESI